MPNTTKQALEESLKHMLLKKPLDKVTIRDITNYLIFKRSVREGTYRYRTVRRVRKTYRTCEFNSCSF